MEITHKFRDQIIAAMPELSRDQAYKIAQLEACSIATVYNHWKRFREIAPNETIEATTIMDAFIQLAISKKKMSHKKLQKYQQQLSAA